MRRIAAVVIVWCLVPVGVLCGQTVEFISGWEGDGVTRGYVFASPVLSWKLSQNSALVLRGSVSYLYYDFPEFGGITQVSSPGGSFGVALRRTTPRMTLTIGPGYEIRETSRQFTFGPELEVDERGYTIQGDVYATPSSLSALYGIMSYGAANEYIWTRAGAKRQLSNRDFKGPTALGIGAELTAQGNYDVRSYQAGGLIEIAFLRARGSLQLRGGYSRLEYSEAPAESKPYFGIGVYRAF